MNHVRTKASFLEVLLLLAFICEWAGICMVSGCVTCWINLEDEPRFRAPSRNGTHRMSIGYQGNLSDWFIWRGPSGLTMAICLAERLRIRELLCPGG